jgi:hypothetical protein
VGSGGLGSPKEISSSALSFGTEPATYESADVAQAVENNPAMQQVQLALSPSAEEGL